MSPTRWRTDHVRALVFSGLLSLLTLAGAASSAAAGDRAAPWMADVAYDSGPLQKLDIYRPAGRYDPLPFVLYLHGGGWWNGDKAYVPAGDVAALLARGVVVVSVNYRNLPAAGDAHIFPPLLGPLQDAKRALQFIRYHAKAFALDPKRAALWGDSAGAFDCLWLGLAPDRADPTSPDPLERASTRVSAIGVTNAQTSIDPEEMRAWVGPRLHYGGHAFGLPEADFDQFLARRAEFAGYFPRLSPAALVNAESPPLFLLYTYAVDEHASDPMYYVHSPAFGLHFAALARARKVPVTLKIGPDPAYEADLMRFLADALTR